MYQCDKKTSTKSSFNGIISELPYIRIDNFETHNPDTIKAYFLSHYHADHTVGLLNYEFLMNLKLTKSNIYCTELTAIFIYNDLRYESMKEFIKPLKMGSTILTLNINDLVVYLTVTLIPAGHCAGSAMFLFTENNKKILYTGDFRININDLHKYKALHVNEDPIKLDALYIDTTFLFKTYNSFPKRSVSVDEMIVRLMDWLKSVDNTVAIQTSARYGYEQVFNEIYKNLGVKVYVDDEKWKVYSQIQHLVPGVTNSKDETRVHLCRKNNCRLTEHFDKVKQVFCVKLSATAWKYHDIDSNQSCTEMNKLYNNNNCLYVCYATHSSATEVLYFKKYFSPLKVVGFPNPFKEDTFMTRQVNKAKKVDSQLLRMLLD